MLIKKMITMQTKIYITRLFVIAGGILFLSSSAHAQEPPKKQTIDITSSFKPTLKDAAKINFNAAPPVPDSSKPKFKYTIPVNSLALVYQPSEVGTVALKTDTAGTWAATNFIKLGYGNFQTPYAQVGLTLDNKPNSSLNILGHFISSKGSAVPRQQYADAGASAYGSTINANNQELYGKLGFSNKAYYLYGYDQSAYNYDKSALLQRFLGVDANIGFRNIDPTGFGLLYHPDVKVGFFNDNHKGREFNIVADVPLEKRVTDELSVTLGVNADYTQFTPANTSAINNFIFTVPLAFKFKNNSLSIHGGATPSWDNSNFKLLPDLMADVKLSGEEAILQFGWLMHYDKGSYQRWSSLNPYLAQPTALYNTRINETYGGIKGTFLEKFFYNAKVGLVQFYNMPLFVNNYYASPFNDGKTFIALQEEKLNAFQMHGEAGIVQAEDFSLSAKFNWLLFGKQKTQQQPWGVIPRELSAALRWRVLKDLWFKTDLFFFEGAKYMDRNNLGSETERSPVDLNAGLEFRVTKQFNLWVQANNIFNNTYQRWNQYEVYGFNILGGIVFNFDSFTQPLKK